MNAQNLPRPLTLGLAPMEGITEPLVREVLTGLGGLDYTVTEFIRVSSRPLDPEVLLQKCPELTTRAKTPSGNPVHLQLLGSSAELMAESASIAAGLGASTVDLNFGCPVKRVNRHDGGASLLKSPTRICSLTSAVRKALPPHVQVSAKVRLGWENPDDIVDIARAVEDGGASFLTVHARTRVQGYQGQVDWHRIGLARERVSIPVVANGDINSPEDLEACRQASGCDRFLLGRGAMARPEVFRILRGLDSTWWSPHKRIEFLRQFMRELRARGTHKESAMVGRLKGWCLYMARVEPWIGTVFERLKTARSYEEAMSELSMTLDQNRPAETPPPRLAPIS